MKKLLFLLFIVFLYAKNVDMIDKANFYYMHHQYLKAYKIYKKIYDKNHSIVAGNNLSMLIYSNPKFFLKKNYNQKEAIKIMNALLKKHPNNTHLLINLALMYYQGYYDSKTKQFSIDREKAYKLLKKAEKLGSVKAKNILKSLFSKVKTKKDKDVGKKKK